MTIMDNTTERHFLVLELPAYEVGQVATVFLNVPTSLGAFQLLELQCADPQALQVHAATWGLENRVGPNPQASLVTGPPCPLGFLLGHARLPILEAGKLVTSKLGNPEVWPDGVVPLATRPTELVLGGSAWRPEQWGHVGGLA